MESSETFLNVDRELTADDDNGGVDELSRKQRTLALMMELSLAKRCIESFNQNLAVAHAILLSLLLSVGLVGFLQPPGGWDDKTGKIFAEENDYVKSYMAFNILAVFFSASGLIYFLYINFASVFTLEVVADNILSKPAHEVDEALLQRLRFCLRCGSLPLIRLKTIILYLFVYAAIYSSIVCFNCSAIISSPTKYRSWIEPRLLFGLVMMSIFVAATISKLHREMAFEQRFHLFWRKVACMEEPKLIEKFDDELIDLVDPFNSNFIAKIVNRYVFQRRIYNNHERKRYKGPESQQ